MASREVGIPAVPMEGASQAQVAFFSALKEAVERLSGQRGTAATQAIRKGDITVRIPAVAKQTTNATGAGFVISGVQVASAEDYAKLVADVRDLIYEVKRLNEATAQGFSQLKGGGNG